MAATYAVDGQTVRLRWDREVNHASGKDKRR
jgi:hypothetical protein